MNHRLLIFAVFLLSSLPPLSAQGQQWELSLTGGYMTPNNFNMPEYSAATFGADVAWWSLVDGDEWWTRRRANTAFGLKASVGFIPTGLSGHRIGFVGLLRASLLDRLDYHIGLGLSYYTKSAYITHDASNIFITTLISCLIDVGFDFRISHDWALSFALLHSSNGMLNRPNKGLNYLQAGVVYSLGEDYRLKKNPVPDEPPMPSKHEVGFALQGGAAVSRDWNIQGLYPCYDLSLNYQYYLDPVLAVGGTLDLWYNGAHHKEAAYYHESYLFPCYASALGFVEGFWGNISVKAGIGPVVVAPRRVNIRFYERVGAYCNFKDNYVGVALNAHAGMIEFIELCYGHRFKIGSLAKTH